MENTENIKKEEEQDYPLNKAVPEEIPAPTLWPIGLAFGILFIFWGFIASLGLTFAGIMVTIVSLAGWIADLKP